jgi:hypothetical protein
MKATFNRHLCAWFLGGAIAAIAAAPSVVGMPAQPPASQPPAGSAAEGISIHGHWTVDVRNTDGSLASHHEFENALHPNGNSTLAALLGRSRSVGTWAVLLANANGFGGPCEVSGVEDDCVVLETADLSWPVQANRIYRNLSMTVVDGTVRLSGQATMTFASSIGRVSTISGTCAATIAPAGCLNPNFIPTFTSHTMTPIPVAAGQIVQVTVVLSFS